MRLDRRKLLKLTGGSATAAIGGLAGCLDTVGLGEENGDIPTYASRLSWNETSDQTSFVFIDLASLDAFDDDAFEGDDDATTEDESFDSVDADDPMLTLPMMGLVGGALAAGFGLVGTGLEEIIPFEDDADTEFETEIDELLLSNDTVVLAGEIDIDEIHDTLTRSSESEAEMGFRMTTEYEHTETIDGVDIYEPVSGNDDGIMFEQDNAIAVSADAIVLADGDDDTDTDTDAVDELRDLIDADRNGEGRAVDVHEEFAWLLETAGHGHIAFGGYGEYDDDDGATELDTATQEDDDFEAFDDATGLVASLTIEGETSASGELAVVFDDLTDKLETTLEEEVGTSGDDVSRDIEADRASVSVSWDEDVLEKQ